MFAGLRPLDALHGVVITIDSGVFGFSIILSLVTGVRFGLTPALQSTSIGLGESLECWHSSWCLDRSRRRICHNPCDRSRSRVETRVKSWPNIRQLPSTGVGDMGVCSLTNLCAKSAARLRLISRSMFIFWMAVRDITIDNSTRRAYDSTAFHF